MASQGTFWSRILIILFGLGVVALGGNELQKEFNRRYAGNTSSRPASVSELHGENVIERAQMRPLSVSRQAARSQGKVISAAPIKARPEVKDSLSRSDRQELQSLIETVSK